MAKPSLDRTLFVQNLTFSTTEDDLRLRSCPAR